jgi:zinc D-Ala-D-Ala dipeptidase
MIAYLLALSVAASSMAKTSDEDPLVPIVATVPDAVLEIRYAFDGNAFGKALYPTPSAYLRRSAARRLKKAADALRKLGYRMVIFDAYRPLSVQKKMWAAKPDRRYVADPAKGSNHNRGAAVDVGLATPGGRLVPFPSEFDQFGPQSAHGAPAEEEEKRHREALKAAMEKAGFKPLAEEWWHYDDLEAARGEVLDISFEKLERELE